MPRLTPSPRVYLDYNATAPLRPQARDAMLAAFDTLGNPSSIHAEGRAARALLEAARATLATGVGTAPKNLIFTSGATEAANLALTPHLQLERDKTPFELLLLPGGEHPCVLAGHRFPAGAVEPLPLDAQGAIALGPLEEALRRRQGRRFMLALQAANNETGVIQPVAAAAQRVHAAGGLLVCDATQAMGRIDATFASLGADILFFSSHKLGGPAGAGALAFASDTTHINETMLRGGGQEGGRRAGTENIAAAAGFVAAFEAAREGLAQEAERLATLRNEAEARIEATLPRARFLGAKTDRLSNVSAFLAEGFPAQTLAMALDLEGIAVSAGSACSSGKPRASLVLAAMGLKEQAMLRVSLGWRSSAKDVELFGAALARVAERMKARRFYA